MDEIRKIKRLVSYYARVYGTNDPFEIADRLGILYQIGNLKCEGCYMFLKNHRYIFLSKDLDPVMLRLVMAHELAHALFDRKENLRFLQDKTLLLNSRSERRANRFAAYFTDIRRNAGRILWIYQRAICRLHRLSKRNHRFKN